MSIDAQLLEILACPKCKGQLVATPDGEGLRCEADALVYPIREDIPVMLIDEAVAAAEWDKGARSKNAD